MENIGRLLKRLPFNTTMKPFPEDERILVRPKDKCGTVEWQEVVYATPMFSFSKKYMGEICQGLGTCIIEHKAEVEQFQNFHRFTRLIRSELVHNVHKSVFTNYHIAETHLIDREGFKVQEKESVRKNKHIEAI